MVEGRPTSESGQAMAGYAILVGAIAVGCALAVLFLGVGINGLWESDAEHFPSRGPFRPPTLPSKIPLPTTLEECVDPGWETWAFASEHACEDYVRSLP